MLSIGRCIRPLEGLADALRFRISSAWPLRNKIVCALSLRLYQSFVWFPIIKILFAIFFCFLELRTFFNIIWTAPAAREIIPSICIDFVSDNGLFMLLSFSDKIFCSGFLLAMLQSAKTWTEQYPRQFIARSSVLQKAQRLTMHTKQISNNQLDELGNCFMEF